MAPRAVLSDFDGTITEGDVGELLLQEFTGDAWLEIERQHAKIGTRETLRREFDLVRTTRPRLLAAAERLGQLDPTFRPFLAFCRKSEIHLEIVSEGVD